MGAFEKARISGPDFHSEVIYDRDVSAFKKCKCFHDCTLISSMTDDPSLHSPVAELSS